MQKQAQIQTSAMVLAAAVYGGMKQWTIHDKPERMFESLIRWK